MSISFRRSCAATLALWLLVGCAAEQPAAPGSPPSEAAADVPRNPEKTAFFGDLHVHSAWSIDAWAYGVRVQQADAYAYMRGEAIDHVSGEKIRLKGPPLDFVALTEHANYMGFYEWMQRGDAQLPEVLRDLTSDDPAVWGPGLGRLFADMAMNRPIAGVDLPLEDRINTWSRIRELANRNDTPGEFTAFVAYEYTPMPDGQNLHRNVVFRGDRVPERPFSSLDSENPEDLWDWMDGAREQGSDVLSIPHNQNGSNGMMYQRTTFAGGALDRAYAVQRIRNEPVSEVMQIKGQSETHPALSPDDEWADFEISPNILGIPDSVSEPQGSYARQALRDGLAIEARVGVNPYRFGMLGSSDGHNASSPVEEDNYTGKIGRLDGTPEARLDNQTVWGGASGLTGIWAEANTRQALFDALRAREVFSTSGPRLRVRLFAGWDFGTEDLGDLVAAGYARGVPMGAVLPASGERKPTLLAAAIKDPKGAPLERLQIVKGWLDGGETFERVFDVACAHGRAPDGRTHRCAAAAAMPDLDDCSFDAGGGRDELSAAWTDPTWSTGQPSFYYARVLQVPTCRWSTYDAHELGRPLPEGVPPAIQERAVSSPVWVTP